MCMRVYVDKLGSVGNMRLRVWGQGEGLGTPNYGQALFGADPCRVCCGTSRGASKFGTCSLQGMIPNTDPKIL